MIKCNLESSLRRGTLQSCNNSIRTRLRAIFCLFQLAKLAKSYSSFQWILNTFPYYVYHQEL